ncbi:hypothetical protein K2224_35670 (plasmid) [Streptomyces sp. BHT-5-2]|uniref:hypothetical protein n=1 Tax=unclassified Streptomyces TaxID=2593676 RepID=UPI001C8EAE0A|nr:hypothetical protein [Streptomyces sp. BHT-5-2]QZL08429.1 hypothetical protein K2224_35670 [Streptomyces sp. BHT-5-2]
MPSTDPYCAPEPPAAPDPGPAAAPDAGEPRAGCVECGRPTEYPAARPGIVRCPVCEWQEAQRTACSG